MSDNKDLVTKYYASFGKLDRKTVLSYLTDDVEWVEWADNVGVFTHKGKAEFKKNINDPPGPGGLRFDVLRLTEENNVVLAECAVRVPMKDGSFLNLRAWDIFEFKEGKIHRIDAVTVKQPNLT